MLVTLQFPIADCRSFKTGRALRRVVPDWPDPQTEFKPQFVHYFGEAHDRRLEPDIAWPDELKFAFASRALRFDHLETQHVGQSGRRLLPACAFRRLFFDGQAVARIEIGLSNRRGTAGPIGLTVAEVLAMTQQLIEVPTWVPAADGSLHRRPMLQQRDALRDLYVRATADGDGVDQPASSALIEPATPIVLIELEPDETDLAQPVLSAHALTHVPEASLNGAKAAFCRLAMSNGSLIGAWLVQRGRSSAANLRSLRQCLTRLHAEREVLDAVLRLIKRGTLLDPPQKTDVDALDWYFNDRLRIVNRSAWANIDQSAVLAAFDASNRVVAKARQQLLIDRYQGSRRQIWNKISEYQEARRATRVISAITVQAGGSLVENNITNTGDGNIFNVGAIVKDVSNTVNQSITKSTADAEVKALLKKLEEEFAKLAPQAEANPEQLEEMGKNVKRLSEEVATRKPNQKWYELSLDGIKDAATALGAVAQPVMAVVAALSKILIP